MALRLVRGRDWLQSTPEKLAQAGLSTERNRNDVECWDPQNLQRLSADSFFTDGWSLRSLWLGRGCDAVALLPRRIYLRENGCRDKRPERDIVDHSRARSKPLSPLSERLHCLKKLEQQLQVECTNNFGDSVGLSDCNSNLTDGVQLQSKTGNHTCNQKLRSIHEQGGFHSVPTDIVIALCPAEGVKPEIATDFEKRTISECEKRGVSISIKHLTLDRLETRLTELAGASTPKRNDTPVWFILRTKEDEVPTRILAIMQQLEQHGLPWRRAYATDNRVWSVPDQVGSLIQAAGGHPHVVVLADGGLPPWSIGIDLSHRGEFSRAAAAVVNPNGQLTGAWILDQQRRGEGLNAAVLRRLLKACVQSISSTDRANGMLVIRDGRQFEKENSDFYRRGLGGPVSLVELRKYGNPPLLIGDDAVTPSQPAVAWLPDTPGESIGFMVTLPRRDRDEFDRVTKVRLPDSWDELKLGRDRLAHILAAQTLTPGLGLHPRYLPAPIYWADGIAGATDSDLRFRGQSVTQL